MLSRWGRTDAWHHEIADDSNIPKMPLISPQEPVVHEVHLQTQKKKGALTGLSIPNPNLSQIAFSVGYLHSVGSLELRFQAIDE
jgi:hypothetical protein